MAAVDVVIIGAGIIGASLAYHLTLAGASVTVVDRNQPATGTTSSSFAYVNAASKRPEAYFRLNAAGMREHVALREEIGEAPWRIVGGRLLWHHDPQRAAEIAQVVAESAGWGYAATWLDAADLARLEPDLRSGPGVDRVAHFPEETAVDAPKLALRLLERAVDRGAELRVGQPVIALTRRDGAMTGVTLANGDQIAASTVMNCAGPDADHVAQLAGRRLPLGPELGVIAYATLTGASLGRIAEASGLLMRPAEAGGRQLLFQRVETDAEVVRGEAPETAALCMVQLASESLAAGATLTLDRWTVGVRPIPGDGVTSAGLVPAIPGYGEIVTHSGVTLGPLLGRLVAREILGSSPDPLLAAFRPDRFAIC